GKLQQIGIFLRDEKWDIVQLRAEEAMNGCKVALTRWGDYLPAGAKNDLDMGARIARSIGRGAAGTAMRELTRPARRQISESQLAACDLISGVLGEARKIEERNRG
ncbi:MAG: hypothetical protein ACRD2O_13160, partial [Terriglobia bacterium]